MKILFYGAGEGMLTFTVSVTDTLARLDTLTFPDAMTNGQSYDIFGLTTTTQVYTTINQWRTDDEWWSIIGPEGVTYGDVLDGTKLNFLGTPGHRVQGRFLHDYENDTFIFDGMEAIFESPVSPPTGSSIAAWDLKEFNSLVEFHDTIVDIIWVREFDDTGFVYQGGMGYAAKGASISWNDAVHALGHSTAALVVVFPSLGALAAPEPTMLSKVLGVAGFAYVGYELYQANQSSSGFARSVDAARRKSYLIDN